ncbi:hypothetical protein F5Y15DRAFT_321481 [Xylariaceae sp. FL0016]|nr:hypothetical protein F5Y15DRAFT_321481 [Xylariaceae sp. FL0016]
MPKHTRSSSSSHNRYSNNLPVSLAPSAPVNIYNTRQPMQMNTGYFPTVPSSASAQATMQTHGYDPYQQAAAVVPQQQAPPIPHRPSSGAWTPQDDANLLTARQQGLNWGQIQSNYFPNKTANACRKRHERLLERKGADDWDTRKLERLAKEYMSIRKEIWQPLANRTGEKWNVVEAKCMTNGLKNLQSAARSAARRERLETGHAMHGYDDDSGISGIGLTPVDDLDASYSSPETTASSSSHSHSSVNGSGGGHHHHHHNHHSAAAAAQAASYQMHPGMAAMSAHHYSTHNSYPASNGGLSSSYSSSVSSGAHYGGMGHHQDGSPYMGNGQRLPSVDMGIDAIINRPGGGSATSI